MPSSIETDSVKCEADNEVESMSRSKPTATTATQKPGRSYRVGEYPANASCVVLGENGWREIACIVCSGNGQAGSGATSFAKGAAGLRQHLLRAHPGVHTRNLDQVITDCTVRTLSQEEVELIRLGNKAALRSIVKHGFLNDSDLRDDRGAVGHCDTDDEE